MAGESDTALFPLESSECNGTKVDLRFPEHCSSYKSSSENQKVYILIGNCYNSCLGILIVDFNDLFISHNREWIARYEKVLEF